MRRWLPYPLLTIILLAMWLLLTQSFSPGQVLLGAAVAVLAGFAMAALRSERSPIGRPRAILKLAGIVAADIIRSNLAVATIVLTPRKDRVAGLINIPLDLTNRHGLAVLAVIITTTPGTLWVELDRRRGMLLVHVLDLVDEGEWIRLITQRYEALLIEIFGS